MMNFSQFRCLNNDKRWKNDCMMMKMGNVRVDDGVDVQLIIDVKSNEGCKE